MARESKLYVAHQRMRAHVIITAIGSIDRTTVMRLRSLLLPALLRDGPFAVVDLTGVDHIDEAGADALRRSAARAAALGGYLRLVAPPPQVAEALHRDDLTGQLHIFRTVAAATRPAAPALPNA